MTARFSLADYAGALLSLLPRGRAWSGDPQSTQYATLTGLAGVMEQVDGDAVDLIADGFPATAVNLLPEWEQSLGLPDPCAGPSPTVSQRQAQVAARFAGGGGQSRQRFIDYAATLGFEISITVYAPFCSGRNTCGQPVYGQAWAFAWSVQVLSNTSGLPNSVLECELNAIKPAETTLFFTD
jgi:uncharacterized protein YmfQ (DUF2313 family)